MRNLGRLYIVTRDNDTRGLCVSWLGVRAEWGIQFGFDEPVQWTCRRIGSRTIPANLLPLLVWATVAVAAGKGVAPVNGEQLAAIAAEEVCERVSRALVAINDACDDECPLTPRQKMLIGTALLREIMGLNVDLERMFHNASALETWTQQAQTWTTPEDMCPIGDEVEAWLAARDTDGPLL